MNPQRIQRKRTKGWQKPANTVYVGRGTRWGNPFLASNEGGPQKAVDLYAAHLSAPFNAAARTHLAGKNLMCWCPLSEPCHAEVLLELANKEAGE